MRKIACIVIILLAATWITGCKHVDEEPQINLGYKKNIRVPDAEPMTADDSAVVAAQKAEFEQNAK